MRWTAVSTGEMTMIADPRIVWRERFLANVTTRRATIYFLLFHRQRFHGHVSGYDDFHTMFFTRSKFWSCREPYYTVFIVTEPITHHRTNIARSILYLVPLICI